MMMMENLLMKGLRHFLEKILFFFNFSKKLFKEQKLSKEYYEKMINDGDNSKKIKRV